MLKIFARTMANFSALGMRSHPLHPHAVRLWIPAQINGFKFFKSKFDPTFYLKSNPNWRWSQCIKRQCLNRKLTYDHKNKPKHHAVIDHPLVRAVASGGASGARPPFEIGAPPFHVWPPSCCIHPILYFKNVPPLLVFGPSWFLAPPAAKPWRRACRQCSCNLHVWWPD